MTDQLEPQLDGARRRPGDPFGAANGTPVDGRERSGPGPARRPDEATVADAIAAVQRLTEIVAASGVHRIVLDVGDLRWEVERAPSTPAPNAPAPSTAANAPAPTPSAPAPTGSGPAPVATEPEGRVVPAPLVGVFYEAPGAGKAPFTTVGAAVQAGQQLAIVEAMKMMNEVVAPCSGTVVAVHVADGEIVEHGQSLFTIAPE